MTTAMIASNSFCVPRSTSAEPTSSTWVAAKITADMAVSMNRMILTRHTDIPRRSLVAAHGEDPVAEARSQKHPGREDCQADPPEDGSRDPVDRRQAVRLGIDPALLSHPDEDGSTKPTAEQRNHRAVR